MSKGQKLKRYILQNYLEVGIEINKNILVIEVAIKKEVSFRKIIEGKVVIQT